MSTIPSYQAVRETTRASGTGPIKLDGPELGYQALGDVGDGNECDFCIRERAGKHWEVVTGIYTAATQTLTRATVIASSNGDQLVDFPAGIKVVTLVGGIVHPPTIIINGVSGSHPPGLVVVPPFGVAISDELHTTGGICVASLPPPINTNVVNTIASPNLAGIQGDFAYSEGVQ